MNIDLGFDFVLGSYAFLVFFRKVWDFYWVSGIQPKEH
jgi:hypothetical protein